jgi:hypothetical protein
VNRLGPEWLFIAAGLLWAVAAGAVHPALGLVSLLVVVLGGRVLVVDRRRQERYAASNARRQVWARRERDAEMRQQLRTGRWS